MVIKLYLLDKFLAQSVDFIKITLAVKGVIFCRQKEGCSQEFVVFQLFGTIFMF